MNQLEKANALHAIHKELESNKSKDLVVLASPSTRVKDRIFRMLFKDNRQFLELYNAMNDTNYDNPEDLIVTTLGNAIYMGMKNDVSFLVYDELVLYEHQSTNNPNMPLRNLMYVTNLYSKMVAKKNLHTSRLVRIPQPKFVVFYNGKDPLPERQVLRLSDAFITKSDDVDLELKTLVLNINVGHNKELMDKCKTLREYMIFVQKTREYCEQMQHVQATEKAVDECIREGILRDFFIENRSDVITMSIFEYDEADFAVSLRAEGKEDGLIAAIRICHDLHLSREEVAIQLVEKYNLTKELAEQYLREYWD